MKRKINRFNYMLIAFIGLTLGACSDYFDVRPKSQVLAEEMFENEQGFNDQLIGVYKRMASSSLYAREMTFGLMEVLSQNYDLPVGSPYEEAAKYNYANVGIKAKVDAIWSEMYTGIANLNVMLSYIDAKQSVFTGDNYRLYKGEALGLRAFLHFDLLRMFAPAYSVNPAAPAIPYVREYTTEVTPQSTVAQVTDFVIKDLKDALTLLEADPLFVADSNNAYTYRSSRTFRFNYYAVASTLARVYQWRGTPSDMAEALRYARMVIEDEKFSWTHFSVLQTSNENERDLLFSSELVFSLNYPDLEDLIKPYFHASSEQTAKLSPSDNKWQSIYEYNEGNGSDVRSTTLFKYDGSEQFLCKYWQSGRIQNTIPIIRWSELFYIAAEICSDNDPAKSIDYLNVVRSNRNLSTLEELSTNRINEEIYKEYRKELIGEGQLFYYYKRLNYPNIPGSSVAANEQVYKLPMPDNEIEFGGRK